MGLRGSWTRSYTLQNLSRDVAHIYGAKVARCLSLNREASHLVLQKELAPTANEVFPNPHWVIVASAAAMHIVNGA